MLRCMYMVIFIVSHKTESYREMYAIGGSAIICPAIPLLKSESMTWTWVVAEDASHELIAQEVKVGYKLAQKEYVKARRRYEESLMVKPDFYEGHLALGLQLQQFAQSKFSWYYNTRSKSNIEEGASIQILEVYNKAKDNMEKGMKICE
ncbi:hypothetical protein Tco_1547345 [Tanacetum coccineum]